MTYPLNQGRQAGGRQAGVPTRSLWDGDGVLASVAAAAAEIRSRWSVRPRVALILGTGLGRLAEHVETEECIPFAEVPGFCRTTALAHRGQVVCGTMFGVPVVLLDGRCHLYEGYSFADLSLPVRVVHACGAPTLIVTNASGGLNRGLVVGDVLVIEDHINLMGASLRACDSDASAPRPPRCGPSPYDENLRGQAVALSRRYDFPAHQGVYAAVTGPNYETRAEYRWLRYIGADVVGMSTVPEVIAAHRLGMQVLGLSVVTNVARPDAPEIVDALHVVSAAERAEPQVRKILEGTLLSL